MKKKRHSSVYHVRSFEGADYLLIAKIRERLSVSKQTSQKLDKKRFDLKMLNDMEVKE
jgi:hypothetical protein